MARRFELRRVALTNYRSIRQCDVTLGPLALLVGPNGSGKSNFLDALRFVSDGLSGTLDNAIRDRGGVGEIRRRSGGHPTHFSIEIEFETGDMVGSFGFRIGAVKGGDYVVSEERCALTVQQFGGATYEYVVRDGTLISSSEQIMPAPSRDRLFLVAASNIGPFREIYEGLSGITVFSLNPDAMRELQKPDSGASLRRDGSNVASVVERLRREEASAKKQIEAYLSTVVPAVLGVERRGLGSYEALEFLQRVPGAPRPWRFQATSVSDGTLRALGVLTALFAESRADVFAPVGIEEPESALHPAAAGVLLEALRVASEVRQVLATTHSPDLLDSASIAPGDLLAVRARDGETTIAPVDQAGRRAIAEHLFTAGELLRADQLLPDAADNANQPGLFAS